MDRFSRPSQPPTTSPRLAPWLAFERLDCYRVSLEFQILATTLVPRSERILLEARTVASGLRA